MDAEVRRHFDGRPESVAEARRFFRDAIESQSQGQLTEDMTLAVSELATNAVRHAQTPFDVIVISDGSLRVEVEDGSERPPERRSPAADTVGGRGLSILDAACDRWGVHIVRDRKCVWCERDLP